MTLLKDFLSDLNISFDEEMLEKVDDYYKLLIEKNKVMNLTSITGYNDFIIKHICDSLLACKVCSFQNEKIIDIGSGAGFPGIPLNIFFPSLEVVLLDSLNKRLLFLDEVIERLNLKNISTVHGRAEDLGHVPMLREKFDLGVSRAVAALNILSELSLPFIKKGGSFVFYKSSNIEEELSSSLKAFDILGGSEAITYDVPLNSTDIIRKFVIVKKIKNTPTKYSRKAGTPSKSPL